MKATLIVTALAAAVLTMAPTGNASAASDYKMYAGSGCKVFGATAWTDLQFGAAGIINLTTSPKNIICPIIKDSEGAYDSSAITPANAASMHLHIATGAIGSRSVCNVYTIDNGTGGVYVGVTETNTFDTGNLAAGTETNGSISNWDGTADGLHTSVMMLCTLGPKATLRFYQVWEQGATATPDGP
jgi:hypothetical protein